jgi:hypothetical protein
MVSSAAPALVLVLGVRFGRFGRWGAAGLVPKPEGKQKGRGRNLCLIRCVGRRPSPAVSDHTGLIKKYQ